MSNNAKTKTIGIVLYPHCTLLDFAGATQVFAKWASGWTPIWLAENKGPVMTSEGLEIVANHTLDEFSANSQSLDVIFVPGGAGVGVAAAMQNQKILGWLDGHAQNPQCWIGSVCVGAFIVAAAGLLRGEPVSTHWLLINQLQRLQNEYVLTALSADHRYHISDKAQRFSGGGVSTSIDLALGLLSKIDGSERANSLF